MKFVSDIVSDISGYSDLCCCASMKMDILDYAKDPELSISFMHEHGGNYSSGFRPS